MADVPYIVGARFVPAASVASALGFCASTSTSTALPSGASSSTATWPSCSSARAAGTGRFTATRQRGSYELWLSVPGHHHSGLDLTIQGG
jgi:hypothetical protein